MSIFFVVLFWVSVAAIVYTYAGYPILLLLISKIKSKKVKKSRWEPTVSVILAAFNEEKYIQEKIRNLLDLDYPGDKIEIIVGSDGGSDRTEQIVSSFEDPRVRFFRFVTNLGKPHVINGLAHEASGTILVFTDARQRFDKDAIRELVANFSDPDVGCVSGELFFEETRGSGVAKGMDAYWRYEKWLRREESRIDSMLGATGAIYAIRRRLFEDLPVGILVDDMYTPLSIIRKGHRAVFDGSAKAYDFVSEKGGQEFTRKVRTLLGNFQIFQEFPDLLNPAKSRVALQLISHKLMRLLVPCFMISAFLSNLFLINQIFFALLIVGQIAFYALAAKEYFREKRGSTGRGAGFLPYMFCLLNYSAWVALLRFLRGDTKGAWKKAYS